MLNLTPQHIIKYLSIVLIVAIILYMIPGEKLETNQIVMVAFSAAVFSLILDLFFVWYRSGRSEHMHGKLQRQNMEVLQPYQDIDQEPTYSEIDMQYNNNIPGYYLINNGKFSEDGKIPYSEADKLIKESKLHDLYNQQNFNIMSSPHTHIGKNRGHLNWDPVYE